MLQDKDLPVAFAGGIYRLEKLIGTGGMAAVYAATVDLERFDFATVIAYNEMKVGSSRTERAEHLESRLARWRKKSHAELRAVCDQYNLPYPREGTIAVKVLLPHLANQSERFVTEWKAMVALSHPNLVQVYAGGHDEHHGMHYYAMELLEGIVDVSPLSIHEQIDVFRQAAAGLQYLHDNGLVHRDIKPANIVCTRDDLGQIRARVTDLGIAKDITRTQGLTMTNSVMGTPFYMAPEQANSARAVTHLSDIYALGATLYYWVSGRSPYQGLSLYVVLAKLATGDKPEPIASLVGKRVPEGLTVLIDHMMDPDPAQRPPDMKTVIAVADQLKRLSRTQLIRALAPSTDLPPTLVHAPHQGDTNRIVPDTAVPKLDVAPDVPIVDALSSSRTRHAILGSVTLAIALVIGAWFTGVFGGPVVPTSTTDGSKTDPLDTPNPNDDAAARRAFAAQLAAVDAKLPALLAADGFDSAVAALRDLAAAAAAVGASVEVRDRVKTVELERTRRADAIEATIEKALGADIAGVTEAIALLAKVDPGHPRLASFREKLAVREREQRELARRAADAADLVQRIERLLPANPAAAGPLIDELTRLASDHPRLPSLRESLARAQEMAVRGDQERTRALAARQAWLDERTPWPDELLARHSLADPAPVALAHASLAQGDTLRDAGTRDDAARRYDEAARQFEQGRAAWLELARTAATTAQARLAEIARTWEQVKRRLDQEPTSAIVDAEQAAAQARVLVGQGHAREALVACGAAEPVLAQAITDAVLSTRVRSRSAAKAWDEVARDRGLASVPAVAKEAAAHLAQGDRATQPLAQIDAWLAASDGFAKAVAEATYAPPNLPFALPKGWYYLRQNPEGHHEVQSSPDRATMIWIDRGRFLRGGCDATRLAAIHGTPAASFTDELPEHEVELDPVFLDKHEVTCARFARFLVDRPEWRPGGAKAAAFRDYLSGWNGTSPPAGCEDHPVVWVPWEAAAAFATWAEKRLPTEAEWERAARGTDGRAFPWGKTFDEGLCNSATHWTKKLILTPGQQRAMFLEAVWKPDGSRTLTMPVGSFASGASPIGALDMAGNAMEWCADAYATDFYARAVRAPANPLNADGGALRAVRGGSWMDPIGALRTTARQGTLAELCDRTLGFRCARSSARK